ncbi:MAG: hypothetical protein QOK42_319 [Frankiaceae bacterium]|nr:hypothetical protein [Frankiaceae bacterium]
MLLIDITTAPQTYGRPIRGVLHVGAHLGEEAVAYRDQGVEYVVWVEGNPDLIPKLRAHVEPLGQQVIEGLVSDVDGTQIEFHVASNSWSSSILDLGTHAVAHPEVTFTDTKTLTAHRLDTLLERDGIDPKRFDMLLLDLQGAELLCLRGASSVVAEVDYIYSEINVDELYVGCVRLPELDAFLDAAGFERVKTHLVKDKGWGEALYVRRRSPFRRALARLRRR